MEYINSPFLVIGLTSQIWPTVTMNLIPYHTFYSLRSEITVGNFVLT
jgi:hypothetical protein